MRGACLLLVVVLSSLAFGQNVIEISVKGISDCKRDGPQQDRLEAITDAKRQACEKAGLKIESKTTVEDFKATYDFVESKSAGVLLPGFQVIDVGYVEDGTYNVVLVGKVQKAELEKSTYARFTVILWLQDKGKDITDHADLLDLLYEWLSVAHGEFSVLAKRLQDYEKQLVEIRRADTVLPRQARFYAFTYDLPADQLTYTQRTPTTSGGVTKHDYEMLLRPGKKYAIEVGHGNAMYFERPFKVDGPFALRRGAGRYPDDFRVVYGGGK